MKIVNYMMFLFLLIGNNIYADVMKNGQIVGLDSTNVATGGIGNESLQTSSVSGVKILTDAVDSTKVKTGSLTGPDLINPFWYTGTWNHNGDFHIKGVKTLGETLIVLRSSLGNAVAYIDTFGNAMFNTTKVAPFLWEVKVSDFATYAADSCTVADYMDTTGVNTMQWFYKRMVGNNTVRFKDTIVLATQIPSSVTPDSLIFKFRSNASVDSATVQCIVKNAAGTILKNTGQVSSTLMNTWEYKNFGAISAMTANQSCAYEFIIRTKYDATVDVSSLYFK
jgi:hypothetical protein